MPTSETPHRLRVIQWGTGVSGVRALKAVIDHPAMELAGLWVHSPAKVGRDAGDLADRAATGILATSNVAEILALEADCVLYMPYGCDLDELCAILASGKNVVTSRFEFNYPPVIEASIRARIEAACAAGNTTLYGTGSSPGFITEAVPLVLLSVQRRLDCLTIDEFADMREYDSPETVFEHLGFGKPPESYDATRMAEVKLGFANSLHLVADAIGAPLDEVKVVGEVATAAEPVAVLGRTLAPGTIAAMRTTVAGYRDGKVLLQFRANWYCTKQVTSDWHLRDIGWRILLEGDAPLDISITNPVPLDRLAEVTPNKTPFRVVNAVHAVCAAPPGIATTLSLSYLTPVLG